MKQPNNNSSVHNVSSWWWFVTIIISLQITNSFQQQQDQQHAIQHTTNDLNTLAIPITSSSLHSLLRNKPPEDDNDHTTTKYCRYYEWNMKQEQQQDYMSDLFTTDFMETHYFHPYQELSDFLQGSALTITSQQPLTEAACEFRSLQYSHHFPHTYVFTRIYIGMRHFPIGKYKLFLYCSVY